MEIAVGILSALVTALAVMQGLQMRQTRRSRNNPNKLDDIVEKLDSIIAQLGRMEMRLSDLWNELQRRRD